jgi:myo-inositol 2-dehydrogenase/D-chiro-inositol 1-dehydrogenase
MGRKRRAVSAADRACAGSAVAAVHHSRLGFGENIVMKRSSRGSRRDFLTASSLGLVAVSFGPAMAAAAGGKQTPRAGKPGRMERGRAVKGPWKIAAIGTGGRGSRIGHAAAEFGEMVACCDVDRAHAERFAARYEGKCAIYEDYRKVLERKGIDVVTIGTPDHWHAPIAIAALRAGKDVYCEKPLTLTVEEGKEICRAVRETGRVFQVGTQQRSEYKQMFLKAVALARGGRLGNKLTITCSIGGMKAEGPFPTSKPPDGLNWDFWLGPAPAVPYCPQRCHSTFRWWLEYSGGKLTDWGAHHVDIAQWAAGCENTGPVEIEGRGVFPTLPADFKPVDFFAGKTTLPNSYNTATEFNVRLRYANGCEIIVRDGPGNGLWIAGEKGEIFVSREKLTGKPVENLTAAEQAWLDGEVRKLYRGKEPGSHMGNFFACVQDRSLPISDVFTHHRSVSACHLCNIAMLLKRKLRWDPEQERFLGDDEANALLSRPRRAVYGL